MINLPRAPDEWEPDAVQAVLRSDALTLVLQPIVDAKSGHVVSYEALLRLRRADGTHAPAAALIASAEDNGLIQEIDDRVLEMGLALLGRYPHLNLSLNVSSLTAHGCGWVARLKEIAAASPGLTSRLTIEITETAMIRDIDQVSRFVDDVRALGCRVAIDDFGAGYTSFRHLKTLNVDILKIDGAFINDLPDDPQSRTLAKTMIEMARALGLTTVAEWVGNAAAAAFLRDAGADALQGYFYGEPKPIEDLIGLPAFAPPPPQD